MVNWSGGNPPLQPRPARLKPSSFIERRPSWPEPRVAALEALWGPGFTGPGGKPEILCIGKPLGLTSDASLLLLGGGLGGPAETITEAYGAWVASFDADPELIHIAEQRRGRHPYGRRMQVAAWDPARPSFGQANAHHAITLEATRSATLDSILTGLAAALRPQGRAVVTELVMESPAPPEDREFAAWCRLENRRPDLPQLDQVTAALVQRGFDVQVIEDLSERHVSTTLAGWQGAVNAMKQGPKPSIAAAAAFVTEAELWLLRIRLMRRFGFRLIRWHAVRCA